MMEIGMWWRSWLTHFGTLTASPAAFTVVILYGLSWLFFSPETLEWHGLATLVTWIMTLFIQRAEHRDTQAIHAKLDELLRVEGRARRDLIHLDTQEPEAIEQHRAQGRRPKGWSPGT